MKFSNEMKLRRQMQQRGWTEQMIVDAMQTRGIPTLGKKGPATRFVHPVTRMSVVIDNATMEIFHVGGKGSNMTEQIFVALLDEDINVWRPVQAEKLSDGMYRIPGDLIAGGPGENWEFPPGSTVICQPRQTSDGQILAPVRLARAAG